MFSNKGLKITIEANKKIVNFLDFTLSLRAMRKAQQQTALCVLESKHPHSILKNIILAINKMLSEISSNKESFDKAVPTYQQASEKSGYKHQLKFDAPTKDQTRSEERTRRRNITCYNPPFSNNVAANMGKRFLRIVNDSFTPGHPLRKVFNKNTWKWAVRACQIWKEKSAPTTSPPSWILYKNDHAIVETNTLVRWVVISLPQLKAPWERKHTSGLPRTNSKQDSETTRLHLEMRTKGTHPNFVNTSGS